MTPEERERAARLRVLLVSHGYGYGDDFMYFGEIFRALREIVPGFEVAVDGRTAHRNPYGIPLAPLLRMIRRPIRRTAPDGQVYETEVAVPSPALLPRLLARRTDVLVTIEFTPPALLTALAATMSPGKRLVLLVESDPAARGGSSNPWVRRIKRWAVRRADAIQTNNARGARYLIEDLGADPARVRVAPYLTSRPPGPEVRIAPSQGPLRVLFANSINPRKGLREFLAALALLGPDERAAIELTVVGDGPERAELEAAAGALGLAGVQFAGRKRYDELGPYYAAAEVLAIPSLADYRSLAGFEGLGYGLALLASRHDGATEETVREGVNGYVIDPADPQGVTDRLTTLIADRTRLATMREASLMLYREHFSLEAVAGNLALSCLAAVKGAA